MDLDMMQVNCQFLTSYKLQILWTLKWEISNLFKEKNRIKLEGILRLEGKSGKIGMSWRLSKLSQAQACENWM